MKLTFKADIDLTDEQEIEAVKNPIIFSDNILIQNGLMIINSK